MGRSQTSHNVVETCHARPLSLPHSPSLAVVGKDSRWASQHKEVRL